jgi:hypothetical protein
MANHAKGVSDYIIDRIHGRMVWQLLTLLWPGYFAAMQNELCKTTNFVQHFPICKHRILQAPKFHWKF